MVSIRLREGFSSKIGYTFMFSIALQRFIDHFLIKKGLNGDFWIEAHECSRTLMSSRTPGFQIFLIQRDFAKLFKE